MSDKKYLTYEEFGAVGDGVHDDMPAIIACHDAANAEGLPVVAKSGATYYIGNINRTATVKTDVDFSGAKIIIDDRGVEIKNPHCFLVASDYETGEIPAETITIGDGKINFPHEGNQLVRFSSDEKKVFIRKGLNANKGIDISDTVIVDKDGNILTPMNWKYTKITKAFARCNDDRPITIKGGIFTTIANCAPSKYTYHNRGFSVMRSHVTFEGITHYVEGEGDHGAPYNGFITSGTSSDLTIRDCLLTPRKTYRTDVEAHPGKTVAMGSYDISFYDTINVTLINLTQTIDINDKRYWGIMGSNLCKNIYMENCVLSRFDAHAGVLGATVKNCHFGYMCLCLIGRGEFYMENSSVRGDQLLYLRDDYGSFWCGNFTVKNCEWIPVNGRAAVLTSNNPGDHDFGYEAMMPRCVTIDGLKIKRAEYDGEQPGEYYVLGDYAAEFNPDAPYPYKPTEELRYSGIVAENGAEIKPYKTKEQFADTKVFAD